MNGIIPLVTTGEKGPHLVRLFFWGGRDQKTFKSKEFLWIILEKLFGIFHQLQQSIPIFSAFFNHKTVAVNQNLESTVGPGRVVCQGSNEKDSIVGWFCIMAYNFM